MSMACMEHTCTQCGWFSMDNQPRRFESCPVCGARIISIFDEAHDGPPEEEYDED